MPCLTEDTEIDARIKKAKSQMGLLRHFFNCKDITLNIKSWIYMARHSTYYSGVPNLGIDQSKTARN